MKQIYKLSEKERQEKLDFYANSSNEICMNNNNRKLGIGCLSLPLPVCSCNPKSPCFKTCYAQHGVMQMTNVQGAYWRNWRLWNEDPEGFWEQVYYKIKFSGLNKVRFHDSGDIPDTRYFGYMLATAQKLPNVTFMAFTKQYEIVNECLDQFLVPNNFVLFLSAWDKMWEVPNPHNLPIAYVKFDDERLTPDIPEYAFHCPGRKSTCSACGVCFNKKTKAVYFDEH